MRSSRIRSTRRVSPRPAKRYPEIEFDNEPHGPPAWLAIGVVAIIFLSTWLAMKPILFAINKAAEFCTPDQGTSAPAAPAKAAKRTLTV